MLGNNGSRIASWIIGFLPTSRWHGLKRFLLRKIGGIQIGDRTEIFSGAKFIGQYIKIGSDCFIGDGCVIKGVMPDAWITMGDWCALGPEVFISSGGHDPGASDNFRTNGMHLPITLGNHVGLCIRSMVMPGITMGDYSSAAPGVVVSRNVKPHRRLVPAVCRTIEV